MDTNIYIYTYVGVFAGMHTSIHVHMHAYTHRHIMRTSGHKNEDGHASACFRCLFPNCTCCFYWFILWFTHPLTAPFAFFYSLNFCFLSIPFYDLSVIEAYIHSACPAFIHTFIRSSPVESYNYSASFHKALIAAGMSMVNPSYPFMRLFVRSWVIL